MNRTKVNSIAAIQQLLKVLKVKVTANSIRQNLENHPNFPSLLAISDCLSEWKIENQTYKIDKSEFDPKDLLFPFMAHLTENGGRFIVVNEMMNGRVSGKDEFGDLTITIEEFLHRWSGIALYATATKESGERNYYSNTFKSFLQMLLVPVGFTLCLCVMYLTLNSRSVTLQLALSALFKISGVTVSVLLLMQGFNANNPFIRNLCNLAGKNDCNALLKSNAAKVTSWLSWSEIGFFYFMGSLIYLLLAPNASVILAWLGIIAMPYTIYSITYQYRTKTWCLLCCTIQVIILLEGINFIAFSSFTAAHVDLFSMVQLMVSFLSPIVVWSFLKPFFTTSSEFKPLKMQLEKFKYNTELFNQALKNQPKHIVGNELMPIVLGNPYAENIITMVSNPLCTPCSKAHEILNNWLQSSDDIQVRIIFATADEDQEKRTEIARHLTSLSISGDKKLMENALNDWYRSVKKDYGAWAEKYPVNAGSDSHKATKTQKEWCNVAKITATPTFLINGYKLPEPYLLEDIKYLIN